MQLVEITWLDHATFHENVWRDREELLALNLPEVQTVGYIVDENKDRILVASTFSPSMDRYAGEFAIIRGCVKKMRKLK